MAKKPNGANGHGKIGHNSGSTWLRRSYNFIDKDPEIDRFRTIRQRERIKDSELAVLAGLASSTVASMFGGQTRRPQHATFAKLAGAMGYEYGLTRKKEPDYEKELPKAREQRKEHRESQRKKRGK